MNVSFLQSACNSNKFLYIFDVTKSVRKSALLLLVIKCNKLLTRASSNIKIREPRQDFYHKASELFDNPCYLEEVSDVLCIALAELPALLPPAEVAEALLHVTNGPVLISRMVANQPDCFREGRKLMKCSTLFYVIEILLLQERWEADWSAARALFYVLVEILLFQEGGKLTDLHLFVFHIGSMVTNKVKVPRSTVASVILGM